MAPRLRFLFAAALCACRDEIPTPRSAPTETTETFEIVEGWARPPASGAYGRVLGVAVAPDGRVWVSHTADGDARNDEPIGRPTIAVLDPVSGEVVEERGAGQFRLPHSLAFDGEGRLWVTDADADRIAVFDVTGKLVFEMGAER